MSVSIDIRHQFGAFALEASFQSPAGVTVLFGRSGSGKTSVINAVAGLFRPDNARIAVDDHLLCDTETRHWLPPHQRRLGYIFQESRLFPHLSVGKNLLYGRRFAPRKASPAPFDHVVDMLGISTLLDRKPAALSGGERQRVAIGRALLASPSLILADEPLAALDTARKEEILPYFERLRDEALAPILYVTHSAAEVARLATSVVVLQEGRVLRQGSASDVLSDPNVTPTGIRDVGAILEGQVVKHHIDGLTEIDASGQALFLPKLAQPPGDKLRVRIAAQDVILSIDKPVGLSALNIIRGTIETVRTGDGPGALVSLNTPAGRVLARVTRRSANALGLAPGLSCHAVIKTVSIARTDIGTG